mmetsp:Transcript_24657/g.36517  ORF Transcript_24657/g.36517 Transcript_24657/m.36517 type:complete len:145 (+) Transcript_24657:1-435(+)
MIFSFSGTLAFTTMLPPSQFQVSIRTLPNFSSSAMAAGPATAEPEVEEKVKEKAEDETDLEERYSSGEWKIRLYNDPFNKREFVARCLTTICGKSDSESFSIMMEAHNNGIGVIGLYAFEIAELYHSRLRDEGLSVDMIPVDEN